MMNQQIPHQSSKHYFRIKGKKAEELVQELAEHTFLTDWCYPNPRLPNDKELCDLLVVFDTTVIIWQIKDLKLGKDGSIKQPEVEKNLRQLSGAKRQLFDLKAPIKLTNPRRVPELFNPERIQDIFLISVLLGESPDFLSMATIIKQNQCHVFNCLFVEIVLNELDTVSDFCAYLREKERIRGHVGSFLLNGGEEELLGHYLMNERNLSAFEQYDCIMIQDGIWDQLQGKQEYQEKKKADEISYLWDKIIDRAHTGDSPQYERVARELARFNRFERRGLAKSYHDGQVKAHKNADPQQMFRRVFATEHATFCFLFAGDGISRSDRLVLLDNLCFVARGTFQQNSLVIGLATEMLIRSECSYDYCLYEKPDWTDEDKKEMKRLQVETGILTNVTRTNFTMDEYPELRDN